jgi:hypothetical protein
VSEESNVIDFPGDTLCDIPVPQVLDGVDRDLEDVFVLGMKDGEVAAWSSTADSGLILLMFERWKHSLLSGEFD